MNGIDWGLVGVFLLSLILLAIIILRKIPQLVIIDLTTIAQEREARVRERLLRERIRRQFAHFFQWKPIHELTHRMDRWAHALETQSTTVHHSASSTSDHSIDTLLIKAETALREKRYIAAEETTMQIIRVHPQHARAYALLGKIKLATRAYGEAREALQFAVRVMDKETASGFISEGDGDAAAQRATPASDRELALVHYDFAIALQEMNDHEEALEQLESASAMLPNDPKILDALLSLAILVKKKDLAVETLEQLRIVNPENEKLATFAANVAALQHAKRKKK